MKRGDPEMVGVPDANQANTARSRLLDRQIHCPGRDDLAETLVAVDQCKRRGINQDLEVDRGYDASDLEHFAIAGDAAHALSLAGMAA